MLGPELEHADTVVDSKPSPRDAAWGRPHPASGAGGSVRLLRSFNPGQLSESQRQRWATDEAGKAAQSQRGKRSAAQMWANLSPEERKAKMAAVRAAKQPNGN